MWTVTTLGARAAGAADGVAGAFFFFAKAARCYYSPPYRTFVTAPPQRVSGGFSKSCAVPLSVSVTRMV